MNIECPICFDDSLRLRSATLKCGHTVCSKCLMVHAITAQNEKKNMVECPLCRHVILKLKHVPMQETQVLEDVDIELYRNQYILALVILVVVILVIIFLYTYPSIWWFMI